MNCLYAASQPRCKGVPRSATAGNSELARATALVPEVPVTSSALALKIDEYVPEMMPMTIAKTKARVASLPKSSSAVSTRIVVSEVLSERPTVCSRLWLTIASNGSPA